MPAVWPSVGLGRKGRLPFQTGGSAPHRARSRGQKAFPGVGSVVSQHPMAAALGAPLAAIGTLARSCITGAEWVDSPKHSGCVSLSIVSL